MTANDSALVDIRPQLLDAFEAAPGGCHAVDFSSFEVGAIVNVHTRYSHYRLVVLDPEEGLARVTGGSLFPEPTEVRVEGATAGGSAIKTGWIGLGLRLELSDGSRRITTSTVQAVSIDPPALSRVC